VADEITYSIKNRNRVLWLLRRIPDDLKKETERASAVIARKFLADTRAAASTPREQAVSAGGTVRKGLVPKVAWNQGTLIMSRTGDPFPVGAIFFGTEFGGRTGNWWAPHRGRKGYVIYPTLRAHGKSYAGLWHAAVERSLDKAAKASEVAARG